MAAYGMDGGRDQLCCCKSRALRHPWQAKRKPYLLYAPVLLLLGLSRQVDLMANGVGQTSGEPLRHCHCVSKHVSKGNHAGV